MSAAVALAFMMTLITGSSNVMLKKAFAKIGPFTAVYLSVGISTIFLWIATFFFVPRDSFSNYPGIMVFVLIGSFAPTIVRTLTYYGIQKLGAGRAAPLRAMTPLFATILAIIFLKESPRPGIFIGILLVVLGAVFLARKDEQSAFKWKPVHFFYPLGAAVLAGVAANLRKFGLNIMPQPVFAATIAATSSFIILTVYVLFRYSRQRINLLHHPKALRLLIIAALLTAIGEIVDLAALFYGRVSLVVPIFAATPLVIVFLSWIFLKEHEIVTRRLLLSAVLIVCGISIVIINA